MERVPIPVVVAVLLNRHRVFLVRRAEGRPLSGQWEFPGGKVEAGEEPTAALRRELLEELGLRLETLELFGANAHLYELPQGPVHYVLLAYRADVEDGRWSDAGSWFDAASLKEEEIVAGSRPLVNALRETGLVR